MALWRVACREGVRVAVGPAGDGPRALLGVDVTIAGLLAAGASTVADAALGRLLTIPLEPPWAVLAPAYGQEIWAAGVTFARSRDARAEEATDRDVYDRVYDADRPELFLKATDRTLRGPGATLRIRADSAWDVPEPELCVAIDAAGEIAGYTVANDMSSRSIEGENPLYLPQAKVYDASCGVGPCLAAPSEVGPLEQLEVDLTIERAGRAVFHGQTSLATMRRRPAELVGWLTRCQSFAHGAFLCTGTSIVPGEELTLHAGDLVTVAITGLGELANRVDTA